MEKKIDIDIDCLNFFKLDYNFLLIVNTDIQNKYKDQEIHI